MSKKYKTEQGDDMARLVRSTVINLSFVLVLIIVTVVVVIAMASA